MNAAQLPATPIADDDDKIATANPGTDRNGARIARSMYEPVRAAILEAIVENGSIAFGDLGTEVQGRTSTELWHKSSVMWYTTSVKLDLEARGLIERHGSPQQLSLTELGRQTIIGA